MALDDHLFDTGGMLYQLASWDQVNLLGSSVNDLMNEMNECLEPSEIFWSLSQLLKLPS